MRQVMMKTCGANFTHKLDSSKGTETWPEIDEGIQNSNSRPESAMEIVVRMSLDDTVCMTLMLFPV